LHLPDIFLAFSWVLSHLWIPPSLTQRIWCLDLLPRAAAEIVKVSAAPRLVVRAPARITPAFTGMIVLLRVATVT
jgi:hypothetical protein